MDRDKLRELDEFRRDEAGPLENALFDDFGSGEMDRQEFVRRASVLGLSMTMIGTALGAFGASPALGGTAAPAVRIGGRIRVGIIPPPVAAGLDPHLYNNVGDLETGGIAGEFLTRATPSLTLLPELATSWRPNANATVWTFVLRRGVRFQSGQAFNADAVVTTFKRLTDPTSGSQALSAYKGVLSPSGVRKINDFTVQFRLDAPTASFPYLTSSTT